MGQWKSDKLRERYESHDQGKSSSGKCGFTINLEILRTELAS